MPQPAKTTTEEDLARVADLPTEYMATWRGLPLCSNCSRKMRPIGQKQAAWPATVGSGANGLCQPCYLTSRRPSNHRGKPSGRVPGHGDLASIARTWTEAQHSVAWLCASFAESATEAAELMSMLGLFSQEDPEMALDLPHLTWHGRPL